MSLFHMSVHIDKKDKSNPHRKACIRKIAYNCCANLSKFSDVEQINFEKKKGFVQSFFMMPGQHKKSFITNLKLNEPIIFNAIQNLISNLENNSDQKEEESQKLEILKAAAFAKAIDRVEKRIDAQLTREIEVALQHELGLSENIAILKRFVQEQYLCKGMIANVAIHDNRDGLGGGGLHAHISLSLREMNTPENVQKTGQLFGKKNREWNSLENVEKWRESWAELNNEYIKEKITHLSYARQAEAALKAKDSVRYYLFKALDKLKIKHTPRFELKTAFQKSEYREKRNGQQNLKTLLVKSILNRAKELKQGLESKKMVIR